MNTEIQPKLESSQPTGCESGTSPPTLYLILHKVRGEPAFDVAQRIGEDEDGDIWIIPTSGHRAYPYQAWAFSKLEDFGHDDVDTTLDRLGPRWEGWPDHYSIRAAPRPDINTILGRPKPIYFKRRI